MARLSGKSRKVNFDLNPLNEVIKWQLPSMATAISAIKFRCFEMWKSTTDNDKATYEILMESIKPNESVLQQAFDRSEQFIAEAIEYDQRLAARARWLRREEGEAVCPALLAQGDDSPFFKRAKTDVRESNGGDAIRVVVSTDANEVQPESAAAFIAAVRLAQQFHPIEVWWQGGWLSADRSKGFIFHIPLIQGDMDFSKLQYVIMSDRRDSFSYCIMVQKACSVECSWNGCGTTANRSYLPNTAAFVDHEGIRPDARSIADAVCQWLGWDEAWWKEHLDAKESKAALQELPPVEEPCRPYKETAEDRARRKEYSRREKEEIKLNAAKRLEALH